MSADIDSACPSDGTFRLVRSRLGFDGNDLCRNCFDVDELSDVPDEWELCRTVSGSTCTIHRTRRDAGEVLTNDPDDYSGYSQPCAILERMDVEEFDRKIGGDV